MSRPQQIDEKVVENIIRFGGDIEKERTVDFFFYFPTEYAATQVEVELINLGFYTKVYFFEPSEQWSLNANKKMKVSAERLYEIGVWMEKIAEEQGGEYDGWGTEI